MSLRLQCSAEKVSASPVGCSNADCRGVPEMVSRYNYTPVLSGLEAAWEAHVLSAGKQRLKAPITNC